MKTYYFARCLQLPWDSNPQIEKSFDTWKGAIIFAKGLSVAFALSENSTASDGIIIRMSDSPGYNNQGAYIFQPIFQIPSNFKI